MWNRQALVKGWMRWWGTEKWEQLGWLPGVGTGFKVGNVREIIFWAGVREEGWSYVSGSATQAGKLTSSLHVTEDTKQAEFGLIDKLYGQFTLWNSWFCDQNTYAGECEVALLPLWGIFLTYTHYCFNTTDLLRLADQFKFSSLFHLCTPNCLL